MSALVTNLLVGAGTAAAIISALFLFGCVMCAWTDDPYDFNRAPLWVRIIGWVATILPVLALMGWMVRAQS